MTHSTAGGIIRSRLRRRSEGCFDWTTYLDVLIQLYYPLQLRKRTKLYCGTIVTALFGVFCGPRDFVVGTPYSTDLSVPIGPASQSITWNRAFKPIGWKQHPGRASANHASNLYLLPHLPNAGALSHTKPGTNVSHLTINTHKCRVSVDGILRRVVNNRPLRESRETCSSIFIVPSLNT